MKNKIEFSKDGTSFSFIFSDNSEVIEINSKEAGFKAILDLASKLKITTEEYGEFQKQILQAENLPWGEPIRNITIVIGVISDSVLPKDTIPKNYKPVEIACFKKCKCGGNHGRIYCKKVFTDLLHGKEEALLSLDKLKKGDYLDDNEFIKVKTEIENELS